MRQLFLIVMLLMVVAGCDQGTKVTGKITFEDDGSPLQKGAIVFDDGINSYLGMIHPNGSYAVGQTKDSQKIPMNKYKVWFSGTERREILYDKNGKDTLQNISFPLLLPEFTGYNNTVLEADVNTPGRMTFDFVVKRHPEWNKQQPYKPKTNGN
ncbi:MAG: hypothetical protein LBU34_09280 [Planctomycetaceae bacterium]|jgi:hypothetical protein|nr:hypothetical protein [Planctomycetaceae bacterium]